MAIINAYYDSVYSNSHWENPTYVSANDNNFAATDSTLSGTVIYNITDTIPTGGVTTSISFKVRAKELGSATITVSLYINGTYYAKPVTNLISIETEYTYTWTGSWTKAQIDAMRFRIYGSAGSKAAAMVDYLYCIQTYTPGGYSKIINGITYSHINGISKADIRAWNDVI